MATRVYSEQVGQNRQRRGRKGESPRWYQPITVATARDTGGRARYRTVENGAAGSGPSG